MAQAPVQTAPPVAQAPLQAPVQTAVQAPLQAPVQAAPVPAAPAPVAPPPAAPVAPAYTPVPAYTPLPGSGVRPSCGCGGDPAGCTCGGGTAGASQLIYAIGTIGFDYATEARRDSFRQQMPYVAATVDGEDVEQEPDPYNPTQLRTYLLDAPWACSKLTWTLVMDGASVYALEAEPSVAMDWSVPLALPRRSSASARRPRSSPPRRRSPSPSWSRRWPVRRCRPCTACSATPSRARPSTSRGSRTRPRATSPASPSPASSRTAPRACTPARSCRSSR
ncbi:hypothetical protein O1L60_21240 [Streptomyces diastatochromogenes]|nr:hypothetical protein [Streptomyces diastatochromogenes]